MSEDKKDVKTIKSLKSSVSSRGMSLAKIGLQAGLGYLNHKLSKSDSANWDEFLAKQSKILGTELGQLKGSLMKAGQMLSIYGEYFLPPEANQFLKRLQSDSPPVAWEAMEKHLKKYFSAEQLSNLQIDPKSLASASMGQVHLAVIKSTQEKLALKIQYPNVDKAIDSDLKALRSLLAVMNLLPKDFNPDSLFNEVKNMLHQEVNYELEADLTEEYHHLLKDDSRFLVPKIYREFSNQRVLATRFMPGVRADDPLIQNLSQERKNKIAESFLELYFREIFEWRLVQTDPHLGNYKIKINLNGEDQLVLLDFGATRRFTPEFMVLYKSLIKMALNDDIEGFRQVSYQLGFLAETDPEELKQSFQDFCFLTLEPFKTGDGTYHWKNNDLPSRASAKAMHIIKNFSWRTPPQEILFLDRKTGGVFVFLSVLGADINARKILDRYLQ